MMLSLVRRLYADGEYRMSLLIGSGAFFGLRISDLLSLSWNDLLSADTFVLIEKKTGKRRVVRVNSSFQNHILACYKALGRPNKAQPCFVSRFGTPYSIQYLNRKFKRIKAVYGLQVDHLSTHSLRKTFGRKVVESAGDTSEMALIRLSELFNHSNVMTTRRYLGLRQSELLETYDLLDF
jgi:integrase